MESKIIQPLWYHPTSVMLVDDDPNLLESLEISIDRRFLPITFTDPKEALDHLKKSVLPVNALSQSMISDIEPSEKKHLLTENLAIDLSLLQADLDKPIRFTKIINVIVDRAMPKMDGLDFCRSVRKLGLPVNLILLTGHTTLDEAVEAFNEKIINAFFEKLSDTSVVSDQINPYINELAIQKFCKGSAQLLGPISDRFSFLTCQAYADFFKILCQKYDVSEYMMIDTSGSCLLITGEGVAKVLLVKTVNDFKDAYDVINDGEAHADVLEDLKSRRAFPFTGTECSHFNFDVTQWKKTMVPMKKRDSLNLYYGIIDIPKKVMSFNRYAQDA